MLKPIRVLPSEQSDEFSLKLKNELQKILQFVVMGNPVELTPFDAFSMPIDTYLQAYQKRSVLLTIDIEGRDEDKIYVFFEFNSAIVLGCYLRQQPELVIKSKIQTQEFPKIAEDAFGEIGNQFTGALDRSIRHLSNADLHLVMDFKKNIFPDQKITEKFFIQKREYIVWISTLALPPYSKEKLTMLIPHSIFQKIVGQRIRLVGITPTKVAFYSWDKEFSELLKGRAESRFCELTVVEDIEDIIHCAKDENHSLIALDFPDLDAPLPMKLELFVKRLIKTNALVKKRVWVSLKVPKPEVIAAFHAIGVHQVTTADAKKELANWINQQIQELRGEKS